MAKERAVTKTEADLDARIASTSDPRRADVLRCARAFKRSWIELAQALTRVRDEESWQDWGFESFDQYCTKELHIRRDTALKLTGSFSYLERTRPDALRAVARDDAAPVPDYRAVDVLARVEGTPAAKSAAFRELRDAVVDEGLAPSVATSRLRDILPPPPRGPGETKREAERFAGQARRLLTALQASTALADVVKHPERLTLDALIDRLEEIAQPRD